MTDKMTDMALRAGRGVIEAALISVNKIEVSDNLASI